MPGPFVQDVHAAKPIGAAEEKARRADIAKRGRAPLYVYRAVENAAEITQWAKDQGFDTVSTDLHVTIAYSKEPVDWLKMGAPSTWNPGNDSHDGRLTIPPGGPRVLEDFGQPGLAVLGFANDSLTWRNREIRDRGASWDYDSYTPHVTITLQRGSANLETIRPYTGKIVLGPEVFEPIGEGDWRERMVEKGMGESRETADGGFGTFCKVAGVNDELGLVFGWAIVCKVDGHDYYDLNIDHDGKRVPEHITEPAMLKGAAEFMKGARPGNDMHEGDDTGTYVFAFPLTTEIAKAMKIDCPTTGLMVAYHPDPPVLAKFKSGEYTGFSIEGSRVRVEEHD